MMKAVVLLCVVAVSLMVAEAGHPLGVVYPFPLDARLECRRPANGGIAAVPPPTIPLVPGEADEVWLPEDVPYRPPGGTIDAAWLLPEFKNKSYYMENVHFMDCPPPNGEPPTVNVPPGSGDLPMVDTVDKSIDQIEDLGFSAGEQAVIMNFWDEVGFPECEVAMYEVTKLPDYYYPPCIAGGRCSGESCSLPEGQRCMPSPRNTLEVPVFRWDCCWDYDGAVWRWACGWYLVNIQIIQQCYCTCRPVFP